MIEISLSIVFIMSLVSVMTVGILVYIVLRRFNAYCKEAGDSIVQICTYSEGLAEWDRFS